MIPTKTAYKARTNMNIIKWTIGVMLFIVSQWAFASPGQLFNVTIIQPPRFQMPQKDNSLKSPGGVVLSINTTIPNRFYSSAGIKIISPEYTLSTTNPGCTPLSTGYCVFSVSDSKSAAIPVILNTIPTLKTAPISVPITALLCLDGRGGTYNCEKHTLTLQPIG